MGSFLLLVLLSFALWGCSGESEGSPAADGDYPVATDVSQLVYGADEDGNMTVTGYTGTGSELVIPEEIEGKPVVAVAGIRNHPFLTAVTLPATVTKLGSGAFSQCPRLTEVTLHGPLQTVTGSVLDGTPWLEAQQAEDPLVVLGSVLIDGTTAGGDVVIPDDVTAIGASAFSSPGVATSTLTSLTVPASVKEIGWDAFLYCTELATVQIEGSTVAIGRNAFAGCTALAEVEIAGDGVTIGGGAFNGCTALAEIRLPEKLAGLEAEAFYQTPWLEARKAESTLLIVDGFLIDGSAARGDVVVPDTVTTIMVDAFANAEGITSLTIPDSVTSLSAYAISYCNNLATLRIAGSVGALVDNAVSGCGNLTTLELGEGIKEIGLYMFWSNEQLTEVELPASLETLGECAFAPGCRLTVAPGGHFKTVGDALYSDDGKTLVRWFQPAGQTTFTVPDGVTEIGSYAFAYSPLTAIELPEGLTAIGEGAFSNCQSLTSINLPSSLASIGEIAFNKTALSGVLELPEGLASIGKFAFWECLGLTAVHFPAALRTIDSSAFYGCAALRELVFSEGLESIGDHAFIGTALAGEVRLPASLNNLAESVFDSVPVAALTVAEGSQTYKSMDGVVFSADGTTLVVYPVGKPDTAYTVPAGVTHLAHEAFANSSYLQKVTLPEGLIYLEEDTFACCALLSEIDIPASATQFESGVFYGTGWLSDRQNEDPLVVVNNVLVDAGAARGDVVIPGNVTAIADGAFIMNLEITSLSLPATLTRLNSDEFPHVTVTVR